MISDQNNNVLRIFASTTDRVNGKLLYEEITYMAKDAGMAGVTVFRGVIGFGSTSVIHTSRFWELTEKLPILIEIVDEETKIKNFFESIKSILEEMPKGCLVTLEPTKVLMYKSGIKK